MKRRDLKQTVNFLAGELMAECMAIQTYQANVNKDDVENIMKNILFLQNEMLSRISHVEPGNTKLFFTKLRKELIEKTDEIVAQIMALA